MTQNLYFLAKSDVWYLSNHSPAQAITQPPGTSCENKKADKKKLILKHWKDFWIFGTDGQSFMRFYLISFVLISRYSITITLINLPSLILAAMTRMRIMMMRQLTRVIFLRLFSVWDTQPPGARLELSSPEMTPSTSGSGAGPDSENETFYRKVRTEFWGQKG